MYLITIFTQIISLFFQVDIDKKLKNAPDDSYQIGVVIGTYLPMVLLFVLAYFLYRRAKKRNDSD